MWGAETGTGIHEMKENQVQDDTRAWEPLTSWLETSIAPPQPAYLEIKPEVIAEIG